MNLIFIGVQGSGKGTQAKIISEKLGIAHISTGDLLRSVTGPFKEEIDACMTEGKFVGVDLVLKVLKGKFESPECKKGFVLDGFPRNLEQVEKLEEITKIDKVIEIHISDLEAVKRISGRWNCKKCGIAYNIVTMPKPELRNGKWFCPKCDIELSQRADDNPEAVKKRLEIYHKETEPILDFYKDKVVRIDGEKDIDEISKEILNELS